MVEIASFARLKAIFGFEGLPSDQSLHFVRVWHFAAFGSSRGGDDCPHQADFCQALLRAGLDVFQHQHHLQRRP
jgi:hypothetical protein